MALADTARLVASLELEDKFSRTANKYDQTISGMERRTASFGRIGQDVSRGLGRLTTNLLAIGTVASGIVVGGIIASVKAASDLNEEIDKSKVVFGEASDEVIEFSKNAASIGLATSEALGAAGAFGNMFNTIGIAQGASADMSVTMVQLAADMASFNNEDPSEMLLRLRSGLAGEAEPLRRFGVLLSEATVKEFAYRTGIAATGEALTEAQKVQARYGLILEQTALQQGNFEATSKSLANQQRILRANLKNTASIIGTAFLPAISRVSASLNEVFIDKQPQITAFAERLGDSLEDVFTDQNIERGIQMVGDFIDRLSEGDVSDAFGDIQGFIGGLASLPWASIGDAARLLGTGSRALLDAFLGMPPWVQTAVLTGWGLNKLTGGALGSIVSTLASGLIRGVLGINAGVVNLTAGTVTGVGGGVPGTGGGGQGGGPLAFLGAAGFAAAIGLALHQIANVEDPIGRATGIRPSNLMGSKQGVDKIVVATTKASQQQQHLLRENTNETRESNRELITNARILQDSRVTAIRGFAEQANEIRRTTSAIQLKRLSIQNRVNVTSNVAITDITRRLVSFRISQEGTGGFSAE